MFIRSVSTWGRSPLVVVVKSIHTDAKWSLFKRLYFRPYQMYVPRVVQTCAPLRYFLLGDQASILYIDKNKEAVIKYLTLMAVPQLNKLGNLVTFAS